jgi:hypothetical protein
MLPIDHIEKAIGQVEEATTILDVDFGNLTTIVWEWK